MRFRTALLAVSLFAVAGPALACGPDTDCVIGDRHYRIRMPEGHDGETRVGAILFMHGYRGTAAATMGNASLGKAVSDMGLALIAAKSAGGDWDIPNSPSQDQLVELDYFDRLLDDVTSRFAVDPERIMATGFSAGGMMTWTLACERGESFAGFAPIAGTFWAPIPETCRSGPVNLIHVHGTADEIVPIEGRPIQSTAQGSVMDAIALFGHAGGFGAPEIYQDGELECQRQSTITGEVLELCLHPGGHSFRTEYVTRAWRELQEVGAID